MLSRFVGAALVLFIGGVVLAGEYTGLISKADKDGITFVKREKGKKGKGEEVTIKYGKSAKITKGEDTVKADEFAETVTKAAEGKGKMKGVFAKITTEGEGDSEKVTKIEITQRKGKAKADKTDK
jgi:hypothetical protein